MWCLFIFGDIYYYMLTVLFRHCVQYSKLCWGKDGCFTPEHRQPYSLLIQVRHGRLYSTADFAELRRWKLVFKERGAQKRRLGTILPNNHQLHPLFSHCSRSNENGGKCRIHKSPSQAKASLIFLTLIRTPQTIIISFYKS